MEDELVRNLCEGEVFESVTRIVLSHKNAIKRSCLTAYGRLLSYESVYKFLYKSRSKPFSDFTKDIPIPVRRFLNRPFEVRNDPFTWTFATPDSLFVGVNEAYGVTAGSKIDIDELDTPTTIPTDGPEYLIPNSLDPPPRRNGRGLTRNEVLEELKKANPPGDYSDLVDSPDFVDAVYCQECFYILLTTKLKVARDSVNAKMRTIANMDALIIKEDEGEVLLVDSTGGNTCVVIECEIDGGGKVSTRIRGTDIRVSSIELNEATWYSTLSGTDCLFSGRQRAIRDSPKDAVLAHRRFEKTYGFPVNERQAYIYIHQGSYTFAIMLKKVLILDDTSYAIYEYKETDMVFRSGFGPEGDMSFTLNREGPAVINENLLDICFNGGLNPQRLARQLAGTNSAVVNVGSDAEFDANIDALSIPEPNVAGKKKYLKDLYRCRYEKNASGKWEMKPLVTQVIKLSELTWINYL
jgi:hypothetical protein